MELRKEGAEIYVPDGTPVDEALARTTHMGVGAHQDDLEIMAYDGILSCFGQDEKWFFGCTCTNGSGSPRDGLYGDYTDEMMMQVRRQEQKKAAYVGEYGAQALLNYASSELRDPENPDPLADLVDLLRAARPQWVYTHNFADKHTTHIGAVSRTLEAIRSLDPDERPEALWGCEVWRDLDWMLDEEKVAFDVAGHPNLEAAILGVFDSQDIGGNRYDLATMGRRRANATYFATHDVEQTDSMIFAMDLTPLIEDDDLDPRELMREHIERFADNVVEVMDGILR
ncbi:MAG: PIG-L family deacetylase [Armatimonadota bacterium]|nr:PIG-L family deacetylase [Armatimonadota bacterium]